MLSVRQYALVNRGALLAALERERVNPSAYALAGAALDELPSSDLEGRYVLAVRPGGWAVYFKERGREVGRVEFDTEDEACSEFLLRVTADPTTRIR
jgi:hypothetical protein